MWFGIQQKYDWIGYIILPVGIDRLYTKSINMVLIKICKARWKKMADYDKVASKETHGEDP